MKTKYPIANQYFFNVRGEPIVNTPEDANCFMGTNLDNLVIGNYIKKEDQDVSLKKLYK